MNSKVVVRVFRSWWLIFLLSSCGVVGHLKGYDDGRQAAYVGFLASEEKEKLDQGNAINKAFDSFDEKGRFGERGTLKVARVAKTYHFLETGQWEEISPDTGHWWAVKGQYRTITEHDSLGNAKNKTVYYRRNKKRRSKQEEKEVVAEQWRGEVSNLGEGDVLLQHVRVFYPNGQPQYVYTLVSPAYREKRSDYLKTKFRHGTLQKFDQNGGLIQSDDYRYQDRVRAQ